MQETMRKKLPTENPRVNLRTCEDEQHRREAEYRRYS